MQALSAFSVHAYPGRMNETVTMEQNALAVNGIDYLLAQDQDIAELRERIEEAAATTGRFVDFVVVGNRAVSVLVSGRSEVVLSTATVQFDSRDTGDRESPFGGYFDLL